MFWLSEAHIHLKEHALAKIESMHKQIEEPQMGLEFIQPEYLSANQSNQFDTDLDFSNILLKSDAFFQHQTPPTFTFHNDKLTYRSNLQTSIPENNTVHGRFFEHHNTNRAIIILPNWNANGSAFDRAAKILSRFGISALRLSLPYHDARKPPAWPLSKYLVSANIGRTISAIQQSVLDVRCAIDWLYSMGYQSVGLAGISIGSCVATIAAAHDRRVQAVGQLLMASNFAEVVWTGIATQHIRHSFEGYISLHDLKKQWAAISPDQYISALAKNNIPILMVTGKYDSVFLPCLAQQIADNYQTYAIHFQWKKMPCGHYTLGKFPFNVFAFLQLIFWMRRVLG